MYILTSLNASRSSLTPIMSAVSASILGPISSTKSSKSTLPPPTMNTSYVENVLSVLISDVSLWCKHQLSFLGSVLFYQILSHFSSYSYPRAGGFALLYNVWFSQMFRGVVPLTDLLAQFNELHFCWHVSHGPHALPQVFMTDVAFFVPVKLHKRFTELWRKHTGNTY